MLWLLKKYIFFQLYEPNFDDDVSHEFVSDEEFEYEQSQSDDDTFRSRFPHLFHLLNDIDFNQIIHESVQINKIEILLAILTYVKTFSLPN